jgi:hypothetical protein
MNDIFFYCVDHHDDVLLAPALRNGKRLAVHCQMACNTTIAAVAQAAPALNQGLKHLNQSQTVTCCVSHT